MAAERRLRLLGRTYCHLCEDMELALRPLLAGRGVELDVIDVDRDAALEARYGLLVPVLLADDGEEICHYHLDLQRLRAYLARIG